MNKRKSDWVMRFKAYSVFNLICSGLTIGLSAVQYGGLAAIQKQGRIYAKQVSLLGPILLTSWSITVLVFHCMASCALSFVDLTF